MVLNAKITNPKYLWIYSEKDHNNLLTKFGTRNVKNCLRRVKQTGGRLALLTSIYFFSFQISKMKGLFLVMIFFLLLLLAINTAILIPFRPVDVPILTRLTVGTSPFSV